MINGKGAKGVYLSNKVTNHTNNIIFSLNGNAILNQHVDYYVLNQSQGVLLLNIQADDTEFSREPDAFELRREPDVGDIEEILRVSTATSIVRLIC